MDAGKHTKKRLLLIIDPQVEFLNKRTKKAFKKACEASKEYAKTMVSWCDNPKSSPFSRLLGWDGCKGMRANIDERFVQFCSIRKTGYAVPALDIFPVLQTHNLVGVDLAGVETDACVLATAFACFDASIDVRVRLDLCGGKLHDEGAKILLRVLGEKRILC